MYGSQTLNHLTNGTQIVTCLSKLTMTIRLSQITLNNYLMTNKISANVEKYLKKLLNNY